MAIMDAHGVVVAYYGKDGDLEPRAHRLDGGCEWGSVGYFSFCGAVRYRQDILAC